MFRWICVSCGVILSLVIIWEINDLRVHVKNRIDNISTNTNSVLVKADAIAKTGVQLTEDLAALRQLAGATGNGHSFVGYANKVLNTITEKGSKAKIGVGEKMSSPENALEWVAAARKEALMLALSESSEEKVLSRLTQTFPLRREFFIQFEGEKPQKLRDWVDSSMTK